MSWLMYEGKWDEAARAANAAALERGLDPENCPVSREEIWEEEDRGEIGCPLCGAPGYAHASEREGA